MFDDDATYLSFGIERAAPVGAPLSAGECVGDCYRLRRILGTGGMSVVYEADDLRLSRRVAIKVVDDPSLGSSLFLEAKALAAVRHPGLPIVHGIGLHRGWPYLVLERLYGVDLEQHLEAPSGQKRLDPAEALPILASVADVLAAVHAAGMAHRDLKPGNIMLCPRGRVVLLDFGIVVPEVDAAQTARCGTPRYLAPEAVRGEIAAGRAHLLDVYAFGALAFEMFSGRPLFEAETMIQMLEHQLSSAAPDLATLRPDLPPTIPALIATCVAKDPADRPGDMETIAGDLRNLWRRLAAPANSSPRLKLGELRETYRKVSAHKPPAPEAIGPCDAKTIPPAWEVLIVEDDDDIREGLAAVLSARGFRAHLAANGREAQELIARTGQRPSVILLDLMMPVMDGHAFLEQQATSPSLDGVPVLLVTAQPPGDALKFASVRGVMQKPLEIRALLQRLDAVCRPP